MSDQLEELQAAIGKFASERDWEKFHTPKNLALAMSVEASEVTEIFQWLTNEQSARLPNDKKAHLADELADTYVYLLKLASAYNIDLIAAAKAKLKKNESKYPIEKAKGLAKKYDEL